VWRDVTIRGLAPRSEFSQHDKVVRQAINDALVTRLYIDQDRVSRADCRDEISEICTAQAQLNQQATLQAEAPRTPADDPSVLWSPPFTPGGDPPHHHALADALQ
jgi:hypothetical protein